MPRRQPPRGIASARGLDLTSSPSFPPKFIHNSVPLVPPAELDEALLPVVPLLERRLAQHPVAPVGPVALDLTVAPAATQPCDHVSAEPADLVRHCHRSVHVCLLPIANAGRCNARSRPTKTGPIPYPGGNRPEG